ncbi:MFS transporter [Qipengyuania soli]|uniref:MFS transporter n=1 Tax=Qipengyuania soli TaxID=2782568 RepID=A0A7S8F6C4_9SPHN|nr:MFS transporter [Qipengyuania soli]QPD00065.1 MFS transporter [Qipengyuania soli]
MNEASHLTKRQEIALAIASGAVVANAYYIHPIIGEVADHFGVSHARIGLVPALNQIALALGIFLLLPLGDRLSNRRLATICVTGQTLSMVAMTLAQDFALFVAGSTLLGFFTITPYLLPAYASKRVAPERLGHVTALIASGAVLGILLARVGAGVLAEHFGWHTVYWIATGLMVAVTLMLPRIMEAREAGAVAHGSYPALLKSVFPIVRTHTEVLLSGAIQSLNFGQFVAMWLGLSLYLTSPEMGYGTDTVGYLAGIAAVSVFSTPRLGRWADRVGPRKARSMFALLQLCGICLLWPLGGSIITLLLPLFVTNLVGPGIDVTSRMTFLSLQPEVRTRLTTAYVVLMFSGAGLASFAGTATYDRFGWTGTCLLLVGMSLLLSALASYARRLGR